MPPLQGMYYFYIAAEQGSLKLAAEKLFVTPAAISQQIRLLEQWLGADLFIRQHRKVVLTDEGVVLFDQVAKGFSHILEGVRLLSSDPNPDQISVSTLPSFAQNWLIPKLISFRERYPHISILLEPSNRLVDFQQSSVDLCIRYGEGNYPKVESRWLMDDAIYAVCHPLYQKNNNIYHIEDLPNATLIEDMWPDMDWTRFLDNFGYSGGGSTLKYSGSHFVLEGALAVQGVALVRHSVVARYISEGKLVRIGDQALRPKFKYFLCAPASYFKREKVDHFYTWLTEEVNAFQKCYPILADIVDSKY